MREDYFTVRDRADTDQGRHRPVPSPGADTLPAPGGGTGDASG
ncbi:MULTISPECIES: hypothetical protein [Streptomyces]|nr:MULTISPECIES: hypothetical protein [unclassified Streptomyces]